MPRKPPSEAPTASAAGQKPALPTRPRPEVKLDELQVLEEKATRLERLTSVLLETPQQAFYVFSYVDGSFLIGQQHVSGLYGYDAGEVEKLPDGWFGLIHPDHSADYRAMHERMMASPMDSIFAMQVQVRKKSGGYEWAEVRKRVFERDSTGKVLSEVGMVTVITGQKEAEAALHATQAASHALFQSNTAGVLSFDGKFQITDANPMICRLLRYERPALLRLRLDDLIAPGSRSVFERMLTGLQSGRRPPLSFETCLESSDGARLEVLAAITCQRGKSKELERGMLIFTDLTASKEAQEGRNRELKLNNVLIDHAPVAICLLDASARVLRLNRAGEHLFGFLSKEVIGRHLWDIPIFEAGQAGTLKRRFPILNTKVRQVEAEVSLRTKDGESRIVSTVTTVVRKPAGGIDFLVMTGIDVTERKRLETEVIRVAEQEQIRIGADLHDGIGQALTGISAMLEALIPRLDAASRPDADRICDLIKTAQEEARRLSHGLSCSAIRNRGLVEGLRLLADTVRLNFRRECDCQLDESITTGSSEMDTHLFRIAQEAVNNALRHGGARHIWLCLRRKNGGAGVLEIADDGNGLENAPESKKVGNSGIGLKVMEYRANLLGGELKLHSKTGKGVRVSCLFPTQMIKKGKLTTH